MMSIIINLTKLTNLTNEIIKSTNLPALKMS